MGNRTFTTKFAVKYGTIYNTKKIDNNIKKHDANNVNINATKCSYATFEAKSQAVTHHKSLREYCMYKNKINYILKRGNTSNSTSSCPSIEENEMDEKLETTKDDVNTFFFLLL